MNAQRKWLLAAILVPIEVVLAALAWRDLSGRDDDQVRGKKGVWRTVIVINPGNSIAYWLFGRRR